MIVYLVWVTGKHAKAVSSASRPTNCFIQVTAKAQYLHSRYFCEDVSWLSLLGELQHDISCSFYTFSKMPEVKEIVVVCDPSYRDIFEGREALSAII